MYVACLVGLFGRFLCKYYYVSLISLVIFLSLFVDSLSIGLCNEIK